MMEPLSGAETRRVVEAGWQTGGWSRELGVKERKKVARKNEEKLGKELKRGRFCRRRNEGGRQEVSKLESSSSPHCSLNTPPSPVRKDSQRSV